MEDASHCAKFNAKSCNAFQINMIIQGNSNSFNNTLYNLQIYVKLLNHWLYKSYTYHRLAILGINEQMFYAVSDKLSRPRLCSKPITLLYNQCYGHKDSLMDKL